MRTQSLEFLKEIVNTPSPPGHEQRAGEVFRRYTEACADEVRGDIHGNVFAIRNPDAKVRIMLAGHIDEIGFIVHFVSEQGYLYFKAVGGHDASVVVGQRVWVHGRERIAGVIGRKAFHLLEDEGPEHLKRAPELHELWIDIGVGSMEEALKLVRPGDVVTYQDEFQMLQGDRAAARSFDNKMGVFVVAETMRLLRQEEGPHSDVGVYGVATVQEEIGFRGATTAAYGIGAQTGIAVDVSHATDYPSVSPERYGDIAVGKGPIVHRGAYSSPVVSEMLVELAEAEGIPVQIEVAAECTGTDATPMQVSRTGMAVGILGVPVRYMHTPCEVLSLRDVEACARLMAAYCRNVTPDTDFTPRA
jgi:putative aminopeptidase FrvX